ncbi:MAG TPA: DUF3108 domain-containing protein [Xanthobacteraceae bacterium]
MIRLRQVLAAGCCLLGLAGTAGAQGKLDGRYTVSLAGVPIGRGSWVVDIGDEQYTAAASGGTTGLLRVFASGQGSSASRGYVVNGNLIPSSYASSITADKKTEELRIALAGGNVKEFVIDPPTPPHPDRIPLTEAHRRGVTDPMSGSLARVAGNGDPVAPEACNRTLAVFDGRLRYDLKLAYKRMDVVKADKGYQGPVVVCALYFVPLAGYIPDRAAIKYLVAQRDMEAWLAPIAGTRVLVPFRVTIPTPLGLGVLEATQFVTTAQPARAAAANAKFQ